MEARQKAASGQFKYMWVNASCHTQSFEAFGLQATQLPTVVLYSPSQDKWAQITNSITEQNLIDFEEGITGQGSTRVSVNDFYASEI